MCIKNIKKYKSSILGFLFIVVGLYLLVRSITFDYWIIGGLIVGGVMLLFTGDRFIEKLEKVIFGKILFEKKKKVEEE